MVEAESIAARLRRELDAATSMLAARSAELQEAARRAAEAEDANAALTEREAALAQELGRQQSRVQAAEGAQVSCGDQQALTCDSRPDRW